MHSGQSYDGTQVVEEHGKKRIDALIAENRDSQRPLAGEY